MPVVFGPKEEPSWSPAHTEGKVGAVPTSGIPRRRLYGSVAFAFLSVKRSPADSRLNLSNGLGEGNTRTERVSASRHYNEHSQPGICTGRNLSHHEAVYQGHQDLGKPYYGTMVTSLTHLSVLTPRPS